MRMTPRIWTRPFVRGATMVETLVLLVLVALIIVGSLRVWGGSMADTLDEATDPVDRVGSTDASQSSPSAGASGEKGEEAKRLGKQDETPATQKLTAPEKKHERQRRASKIHPLVVILIVGLMILLLFVMFAGAREEG